MDLGGGGKSPYGDCERGRERACLMQPARSLETCQDYYQEEMIKFVDMLSLKYKVFQCNFHFFPTPFFDHRFVQGSHCIDFVPLERDICVLVLRGHGDRHSTLQLSFQLWDAF